ncbi:Crossover junction endonuclease MUS81 like protein [Argiope bruennichi]|uniref:Crossover junction endonuclease MUS81 n=1 Tax=Argiope bruennichi TaxID=94029 RepID=A0A8T0EJC9_ARGBR|nr:Crossover junction endonuclease MUS81 like protein [Argiope bruennichi]
MDNAVKRRLKKKYTSPNPLFVKWLTEWKQDAKEKGLKLQYTYAKALSSLKKYPLPLSSGKEAKILEYFGDKLCAMLDAKLVEWRKSNISPSSSQSSSGSSTDASTSSSNSNSLQIRKPAAKPSSARVFKNNVQVKTVNIGRIPVKQLAVVESEQIVTEDVDSSPVDLNTFYLFPGHFSIVLCVDNCETVSGHGRNKKLFISELQKCGVEYEVRKLHVGDFLWIARDNSDSEKELVLDFIVERKRLDDLAHSIKDGRFREQKFRMKNSCLKNPIYLVENCSGAKYLGLPESTLEQAMINTQICDGFLVKRTQGIKESVTYLSLMTKMLRRKYENLTLVSGSREVVQKKTLSSNIFMSFREFNCSSIKNKNLTIKEMFAKHLLQFFGLSVDRAAAIVEVFKTPSEFIEALEKCTSETEKIQLISSIKYGLHKKNIGPALSKSLLQFYSPS